MTVDVPPPKTTRFGAPLVLSRVHWVRPELVAEVTYLTWTADGLLRHVVYEGLREDKAAREVRRVGLRAGGAELCRSPKESPVAPLARAGRCLRGMARRVVASPRQHSTMRI